MSRLSVSMVIIDLLRLMRVLYGSVMDAFMNFSNHSELSCLLALFFHSLGLSQPHSETSSRKLQISLDTSLCSHIPYLPLSTQDNVSTLCYLNTVLKHTCSGLGNWKGQLAWTHWKGVRCYHVLLYKYMSFVSLPYIYAMDIVKIHEIYYSSFFFVR